MRNLLVLLIFGALSFGLIYVLNTPMQMGATSIPAFGDLLDPVHGVYRTARQAQHPREQTLQLVGMDAEVQVVRDDRGVPHIFAQTDLDAVRALGYVIAQDRLFQMDFLPRLAAGQLASVIGPRGIAQDRFSRATGMEWGVQNNYQYVMAEDTLQRQLLEAYSTGVNAYINQLDERDLPLEFRLLGHRPQPYSALQPMRLMQYMNLTLSYRSSDVTDKHVENHVGTEAYTRLFPAQQPLYVPIIPEPSGTVQGPRGILQANATPAPGMAHPEQNPDPTDFTSAWGFDTETREGIGSNNWAVSGARSVSGKPLLAGDPHLRLSMPAIWYEVHTVTPNMNVYGVTLPGSPVPAIIGFNDDVAWSFTNTGSDQIDYYRLTVDSTRTKYWYEGAWRDMDLQIDSIEVKGGEAVPDTLRLTHWGPVQTVDSVDVAVQWTAHKRNRSLVAFWGIDHATDYASFWEAMRHFDAPMQNAIYADRAGNIAIRSTGYMPIRAAGHGRGLLDGTVDDFAWTGRVPFEDLPHSYNPSQGWLSSSNQQPTTASYPYYVGPYSSGAYRSVRIAELLESKTLHGVEDFRQYQADVLAVQRRLFVPLLDSLTNLTPRSAELRDMLSAWDGVTSIDRPEPLVLFTLLRHLPRLVWDEFTDLPRRPSEIQAARLLAQSPNDPWLDRVSTSAVETAPDLLAMALDSTVQTLESQYGWDTANWRWGDHHKVFVQHLTQIPALSRGPYDFPGFSNTVSPAGGRTTVHSASWRMLVDFSTDPPTGYGVFAGGPSGNPFSKFYDVNFDTFLNFEHFTLLKPRRPEDLAEFNPSARLTIHP